MKRSLPLLLCCLLLNACSLLHRHRDNDAVAMASAATAAPQPAARTTASDGSPLAVVNGVEIETVEFRPGISSATVEKLAKQQGCTSSIGAGLVSQPGPVEVYRMACENGQHFLARCELRQCKAM